MSSSVAEFDIEDFVGPSEADVRVPRVQETVTFATRRRRPQLTADEDSAEASSVPGTQSIWIKTFGCAHNTSDSEVSQLTL
jgi:hypothetical protein